MAIQRLAIIGDGIIGTALAFEAISRGLEVSRFSRSSNGPASIAAGGMLTPAMEADLTSPALFELARLSRELYPTWIDKLEKVSGLKTGYRQSGTLEVALHRDHLSELEQLESHQARLGFSTKRLSASEVLEREPQLTHRVQGALLAENDHCVEPRRLLHALESALQNDGVEKFHVDSLDLQAQEAKLRFTMDGALHDVGFDHVIVASGARDQALLPDTVPNLRPVKGQYIRVRSHKTLSSVRANARCLFDPSPRQRDLYRRQPGGSRLSRWNDPWRDYGFTHRCLAYSSDPLRCRNYRDWLWVPTSPRPRKPLLGGFRTPKHRWQSVTFAMAYCWHRRLLKYYSMNFLSLTRSLI